MIKRGAADGSAAKLMAAGTAAQNKGRKQTIPTCAILSIIGNASPWLF